MPAVAEAGKGIAQWDNNRWEGWKRSRDRARSRTFYINTISGHHQWDEPTVPADQRPNRFGSHELPELVQKLWLNKSIFSKSWARDLWVVMKNRHIVFSILLVHPMHPFSKLERLLLLVCTVLFGFGLSAVIIAILDLAEDAARSDNNSDVVGAAIASYDEFKDSGAEQAIEILSTVLVQTLYDNLSRALFVCSCSQWMCHKDKPRCQAGLERLARYATYLCLFVALCVALFALWTIYLPFRDGSDEETAWAEVLQTWGITRAIAWLGTSTLVVILKFAWKRHFQLKAYHENGGWGRPSQPGWVVGGEMQVWTRYEDLGNVPPGEPSLCSNVGRVSEGVVTTSVVVAVKGSKKSKTRVAPGLAVEAVPKTADTAEAAVAAEAATISDMSATASDILMAAGPRYGHNGSGESHGSVAPS